MSWFSFSISKIEKCLKCGKLFRTIVVRGSPPTASIPEYCIDCMVEMRTEEEKNGIDFNALPSR